MAGYLYNGVPLPKLPDWDKTVYPYAVIVKKTTSPTHTLYMTKTPVEYVDSIEQYRINGTLLYADHYSDIGWDTVTSYGANLFYTPDMFIWSNYDILNTDGTLYLAASEPVPITAPVIDPLSLFLGWKAGNWVARQRGKVKQQWETIFDEQVTFVKDGAMFPKHYIHFGQGNNVLALGDILRVTVDGVLYDLEMEEYTENCIGAGNKYLYDAESDDNGLDFMIFAHFIGMYEGEAISYRTEGTHSIKIERRLVE